MGLFGKMFEKKVCSICGGEIGMLGNRKLDDGNMCKKCAAKLSPFFTGRRRSSVEDIKAQLEYREANKAEVEAFNATLTLGESTKILIDEDNKKFMVTSARNIREANPDVIEFSKVTGVDIDIDEDMDEETYTDNEGNSQSYNPKKYTFSYDFNVVIRVNNPYFDEIKFQLNPSGVTINEGNPVPSMMKPNPEYNQEYRQYKEMCDEIKATLTSARREARESAAAANAPRQAVVCKCCGATTTPDVNGTCEFCGGAAV